jgi:hypothetical protein
MPLAPTCKAGLTGHVPAKSRDKALLPDPKPFADRKEFPIFDPAEEAILKK